MDSQTQQAPQKKPIIYLPALFGPQWINKELFSKVSLRYQIPKELMNHYVDKSEGKRYENMTFDAMADGIIAYADSLGLDKFTIGGYCFGGRVAIVCAAKYPHRVDGLLLIETAFGRFEFDFLDLLFSHLDHIVQKQLSQQDTNNYLLPFKEADPKLFGTINYLIDKTKPLDSVTEWRLHYDLISKNYVQNLETLEPNMKYEGPVHIILGERIEMKFDMNQYFLAFPNLDKDLDFSFIKNAGHSVGLENPDDLAKEMDKAFAKFDRKDQT